MKKRILSVICAMLALVMVFQLTGTIQPLTVSAAKSSSEIKKDIEAAEKEKEKAQEELDAIRVVAG